jgi:RNA recognition motif-containing protein
MGKPSVLLAFFKRYPTISDEKTKTTQIDPKRAIPREEHLRNTRYFVGGLAPQTTADSMRAFFSTFGKVVDATVMVDRETGRSKGFGFVTFEDNSNDSQLVGKLGLILDEKQVRRTLLVLFLYDPHICLPCYSD